MQEEMIRIIHNGPVIHVINNNPAARNALSPGFITGFTELLDGLAADRAAGRAVLRAIVLSGAEGFFCSGGNLDGLKTRSQGDYELRRSNVDRINRLIMAMRGSALPIIAAVEGGAAGAGVGLAMACDMICAAEDAFFMASYVKIGLTPDGGLTPFMTEAMPRWLLAQLVFTGDKMPVRRLYDMGVVNELTKQGAAESTALAMAERLAGGPAQAIAQAKQLIASARQNPLSEQLEIEAHTVAGALGSRDGKEGIAAFLEKRKPDFS